MAILRKGNLGPYHCHGCFHCCFGFMFSNGIIGALNNPNQFILGAIRSLLALAPAFVLHEIAHKFMAKRYGCWAEFRADPSGLRFGLILSALTGIVFMAPGAVMVLGRTTTAQFGRIVSRWSSHKHSTLAHRGYFDCVWPHYRHKDGPDRHSAIDMGLGQWDTCPVQHAPLLVPLMGGRSRVGLIQSSGSGSPSPQVPCTPISQYCVRYLPEEA